MGKKLFGWKQLSTKTDFCGISANVATKSANKQKEINKEIRFLKSAGQYLVEAHRAEDAQDMEISVDECENYLKAVASLALSSLSFLLSTVHSIHFIRMNMVLFWEKAQLICFQDYFKKNLFETGGYQLKKFNFCFLMKIKARPN